MFKRNQEEKEFKNFIALIQKGDLAEVKRLVSSGFDINRYDSKKCTPLIYACEYQKFEFVEYFVSIGADISHQEECGYDAEGVAAWHGEYRNGAYTDVSIKITNFLKKAKNEKVI